MTIRSSALHSCHAVLCVEGCLFEAHLSCAFGAPLLQGAARIACNAGRLFSAYAFTRIRVRQRAHGFASDDDTEWRFALLSYWSLRRRVPLRGTSILRLRRAPLGFIGRRPSGQARHLFGWSQTRKSLCGTPVSKWLLIWHAIPRAPLISKLVTLQFYDAPHQNLAPINLNPYAFTASHAISER